VSDANFKSRLAETAYNFWPIFGRRLAETAYNLGSNGDYLTNFS